MFTHTAGIVLVGTHSWTNSAFDSLASRSLLPIAHRPLIWYGLSWLHDHGVREVSVCGNRETRLLESRLARHVPSGMRVTYHQDPMPRGAAGSARDAALATAAETFIVSDGSSIPTVDLSDVLASHRASGACVTVIVHSESRRNRGGDLHAPSGIYLFERRAFDFVPSAGFCDIKEKLIPALRTAGERVVPYYATVPTPRVMDAASYRAANEWMIERLASNEEPPAGYARNGQALVHHHAFVAADARLIGPVIIGPGAKVMSGAVIVGPTSIGRDATIASGGMVSRSAIWRRSTIGEHAIADQCILADDGAIDPGAHSRREVVLGLRPASTFDWVEDRQLAAPPRKAPVYVGARLGRLVFGPNWSRTTAAP